MRRPGGEKSMSFVEHLGELRRRLIVSLLVLVTASLAAFGFAGDLAKLLMRPVAGLSFVVLSPAELFIAYTKLALAAGLLVALPVIAYQVWAFVNPALGRGKRRALAAAFGSGGLLFALGAAFAFEVVLPMTIKFFLSYSLPNTQTLFSIDNYFSFVYELAFSFGAAFELPLVAAVLGALGILSHEILAKGRRYAVLVILIVAAILSPPDVVSQILLAIPMLGLYELSILVLRVSGSRRRRAAEVEVTLSPPDLGLDRAD